MTIETKIEFSVVYESIKRLEKAIELSNKILTALNSRFFDSNIYEITLIVNYQYIDTNTSEMILRNMPAGHTMYDVKNHRNYSKEFKKHADLYTTSINVFCVKQNFNYINEHIVTTEPEQILITHYIHILNKLLYVFIDRGQFTKNDMEEMNDMNKDLIRLDCEKREESVELPF